MRNLVREGYPSALRHDIAPRQLPNWSPESPHRPLSPDGETFTRWAGFDLNSGQEKWAMAKQPNGSPILALTFDDVLLKPGLSDVLPSEVDIRTRVTREIRLNIPIIASAMDTVTEAAMAIAMAQAGGIGVIHRNLDPDRQARLVRPGKKFASGIVGNPLTIPP